MIPKSASSPPSFWTYRGSSNSIPKAAEIPSVPPKSNTIAGNLDVAAPSPSDLMSFGIGSAPSTRFPSRRKQILIV